MPSIVVFVPWTKIGGLILLVQAIHEQTARGGFHKIVVHGSLHATIAKMAKSWSSFISSFPLNFTVINVVKIVGQSWFKSWPKFGFLKIVKKSSNVG